METLGVPGLFCIYRNRKQGLLPALFIYFLYSRQQAVLSFDLRGACSRPYSSSVWRSSWSTLRSRARLEEASNQKASLKPRSGICKA